MTTTSSAFTAGAITSNAIKYRLPAGIAGDLSRAEHATVEAVLLDGLSNTPTKFGVPVKMVSGKAQVVSGGETSAGLYGFLIRPYPYNGSSQNPSRGSATPSTTQAADVARKGYVMAHLDEGSGINQGDIAYVRITVNGGNVVGNITNTSDTGKCIQIGNFCGPEDANGIVEISFNFMSN